MRKSAYETTFRNEDSYWWYVARREIVLHLRKKRALEGKPLILNLGCGTGGLSHDLQEAGRVVSLDLELDALKFCRNKSLSGLVQGNGERLPVQSDSCDEIYALDFLEHLPDDRAGAGEIFRCLKPETGFAVVTVPAFRFLWSKMDDIAHHRRRYRRGSFKSLLRDAGFTVEKLTYFNFFLFPLAVAHKLSEKKTGKADEEAFIPSIPRPVNGLFRAVFAAEKRFLEWCRFPFGVSLLAVLRKDR